MRKWFSRNHDCPPDVEITLTINGMHAVGPVTGENLAYTVEHTYDSERVLDLPVSGRVVFKAVYVSRKKPK